MISIDDALTVVRLIMPVAYIALNLSNPFIIGASAALIAIELISLGKGFDVELTLLNIALITLMNPIVGLILSIPLTLILDSALRRLNDRPWWVYAVALALGILTTLLTLGPAHTLAPAVPLTYLLALTLINWILFNMVKVNLSAGSRLEAMAGVALSYGLRIRLKPRIRAIIRFIGDKPIVIEPSELLINGEGEVRARARFQLGGVRRPRLRIRFTDVRRLISVERVIRHPPIYVTPRIRAAVEYAELMLSRRSVWGIGDVDEVKEYAPGDPIRRIHWKKTLKLSKLIVKVLREAPESLNIALIPYASSEVNLDRLGELAVLTIALALANGGKVTVHILDEEYRVINVDADNLRSGLNEVLASLINLNVRLIKAVDAWGFFNEVKAHRRLRLSSLTEPIIVVGEEAWVRDLCAREEYLNTQCLTI